MKPINPLFDKKSPVGIHGKQPGNVRKKAKTRAEGRKVRCDKKKDVKIPFTAYERQLIKKLAKLKGQDPTPYCTELIKKGLTNNYSFVDFPYDPKGKPYPVKLESYFHDLLFDYKVQWDCSLKEAAYRIVSYMLTMEEGRQ
ncbi:hypothetical protein QUF79_00190 [Fictibacillus enclensis]|uniref:hypothetical protein n=1 Tax=Fictibacillus enclensis TaxID=1017270 RepID=UPI0025A2CAF4|nr:hypothetical protein [Fictibacillus enclensis]MDM5196519.1 hypothetical protein [Fictibacillus enclensis]